MPKNLMTAPLVAFGLIAGFGVADLTGVRALGGVVLLVAGVTAGLVWRQRDGAAVTTALSLVYLAAFVGSHLLAKGIGAWPSVFAVSLLSASVTFLASDRRRTA